MFYARFLLYIGVGYDVMRLDLVFMVKKLAYGHNFMKHNFLSLSYTSRKH